jgi:hypothetical protein
MMNTTPVATRAPAWALALAVAASTLAACASPAGAPPPAATPAANGLPALTRPLLLLGEVHDNPQHHAERLQALRALLARGARPVLAMEQLDRERQGAIDALFADGARPTAEAVIAAGAPAGGQSGWDWQQYRPFIETALQAGLPIVAANVGREEARRVMREGLAAHGFDPAVPADVQAALVQDIVASHCGMVDETMAGRMAQAQVARDQFMARVLQQHAARGVVLLAGNGHVRIDVGAPRWLPPALRAQSQAVGWLEAGPPGPDGSPAPPADPGRYDTVRITPAHPRPDPCEGMRKQVPARPTPSQAR